MKIEITARELLAHLKVWTDQHIEMDDHRRAEFMEELNRIDMILVVGSIEALYDVTKGGGE